MGYKLIVSDLDETLLNDQHRCPQSNIDAIKKAREEYGVKFVCGTGRGYPSINRELQDIGLYDMAGEYSISYNGGAITENKDSRVITFKGLGFEKMKEIFQFGLNCDVCIHVYTIDSLYMFNANQGEIDRFNAHGTVFHVIEENSVDFLKDEKIAKILFQNLDVPYLKTLEPQMQHIVKEDVEVSYSSNRYIEFNARGVDKGQGVIELASILGIDIKDTIAVGDNYNDLSMLRVAGLSVAANNAVDDVKKECDYVTNANNNEGVIAELIAKFIFNEDV